MKMAGISVRLSLAGVLVLLAAGPCPAVITALTPLKAFLEDADFVVMTKVEKLYPEKPAMVLAVTNDLKGKAPFRRLPVNLSGDEEAKKQKDVPALLKRLAPDMPVILFIERSGKVLTTFAYSNGTWFQIVGRETGKD